MAADTIEVLGRRLPDTLHLTGADVADAFRGRPLLEGQELAAALVEGFTLATTDADRQLLAEQIERFGIWTCTADDDEVTCSRL